MFNLLKWWANRQRRECSEEMDLRLTGPLPATTNVCLLHLVEPTPEVEQVLDDLGIDLEMAEKIASAQKAREDTAGVACIKSNPMGPNPYYRKFKESRADPILIFDEPPLTDREKEIWDRVAKKTPKTFQCGMCLGVFEQEWTEAEAIAEAEKNGFDVDECGLVCDDCYKKTPWGKMIRATEGDDADQA